MDIFSRLLRLTAPGIIRKGKKYVKPGQKPPKGVTLHRGKRGGTYYLIEDKTLKNEGKYHELVRSVGVTKDQFDEITRKHLAEGAESVHFVNKPENEHKDGKALYNIYVRLKDTDQKIADKKQAWQEKRKKPAADLMDLAGDTKNINTMLTDNSNMPEKDPTIWEPISFDDGKKKGSVTLKGLVGGTPQFTLKIESPVSWEGTFGIGSVVPQGIKMLYGSGLPSLFGAKKGQDVALSISDEVRNRIQEVGKKHKEEYTEESREKAKSTPIKSWWWERGYDSDRFYLRPEGISSDLLEYRPELKEIIDDFGEYPIHAYKQLNEKSTSFKSRSDYIREDRERISHEDLMDIYNTVIKPKKEEKQSQTKAKKEESDKKRSEIFDLAKKTGEPQILKRYTVECNDPHEECDMDNIIEYAHPDGTTTKKRFHTW